MPQLKQHLKQLIILVVLISVITGCSNTNSPNTISIADQTTFEYASIEKAHTLIATEDDYITGFTDFDFKSKIPSETKTIDEYIRIAQESVSTWSPEDISNTNEYIQTLSDAVVALDLNIELPETIYLIQSSCKEEDGASGYTRQNFIVLKNEAIDMNLIAHEFFHIVSRYNPDKAEEIYASIGFTPINSLELPPVLAKNIITNPDVTKLNYKISVTHDNKLKEGVLLMFSSNDYA